MLPFLLQRVRLNSFSVEGRFVTAAHSGGCAYYGGCILLLSLLHVS